MVIDAIALPLLALQLPATAILLARLLPGAHRRPPVAPQPSRLDRLASVSAIVPTLNEVHRLSPCLEGLRRQSYVLREVIVVDSHSTDGTPDLVKAASQRDPRLRLVNDDPLPRGWVGRPWALHHGFLCTNVHTKWVLGIDADTQPQPGLIAGLIDIAETEGYDLLSLGPKFIIKHPGEAALLPALMLTLVYRCGVVGTTSDVDRVLANGQCFLCRRSVLDAIDGYTSARRSFCDDVTLARNIAKRGYKVGFLDGSQVLKVRMYEGALETWNEWGRSLDLKDATSGRQLFADLWLLFSIQALPILILTTFLLLGQTPFAPTSFSLVLSLLLALNLFLFAIRLALQPAIISAYEFTRPKLKWFFWLSPLIDPIAALRIFLSAIRRPKKWRGRKY